MGWGTFIVGRALSKRQPEPTLLDGFGGAVDNLLERRTDFEVDVLNEIKRMQSEGIQPDLEVARATVRKMVKARKSLGASLKILVVREAQKKLLANEVVHYQEIERAVLIAHRPFPWGLVFQWLLIPYVPLSVIIYKKLQQKNNNLLE